MTPPPLYRLPIFLLGTLATAAIAHASVIEEATDSKGTFNYVLQGGGTVALVSSPIRSGSQAHKCSIPVRDDSGPTYIARRAEIDDGQFGAYSDDTFWYGVSYYLPNDGTWDGNYHQFLGQMRLSNLKQSGYAAANCSTVTGYGNVQHGGSGHHIAIKDGRWQFQVLFQDPGVGSCLGSMQKVLRLPVISKGVWTDFVIQAKWSHLDDGVVRIWMQVNGGGYQQVAEYLGPNWFDTYAVGSALAGQKVNSPNLTAGLYYNDDGKARTVYVDEIRVSDFPSNEGFNQVKVNGTPAPAKLGTEAWSSTNIGPITGGNASYADSTSTPDQFSFVAAGSGPGGTSDQLRFTYVTMAGDGEVIMRSTYLQNNVNANAQIGIMIRDSLAPNSAAYAITQRANGEVASHWRLNAGNTLTSTAWQGGATLGKSLRLVRFNNTLTTYYSVNGVGTGWKLLDSRTIPFGSTTYVGLCASSGVTATSIQAKVTAAGLVRVSAPTPAFPAPGPSGALLAARFTFDNTLVDSGPSGSTLTAGTSGTGSYSTDSRIGTHSLSFNGINQWASSPANPMLSPTGGLTISGWVKPSIGASRLAIVSNSLEDGYYLRIETNGKLTLVVGRPGSAGPLANAVSQGAVPSGQWSHVAVKVQCEPGDGKSYAFFYINGSLVGTYGINQEFLEQGIGDFVVGASQKQNNQVFNGLIDDLRIYNLPLTSGEIATLAAGGEPSTSNILALADFETPSGYILGEINGQPSAANTAMWTSNPATGGIGRVLDEPSVSNRLLELRSSAAVFTALRYAPLAEDLGLAALTPANEEITFSLDLRVPDFATGNTTVTHNLTILRDSDGANRGRALRLSIRRDGRITLLNNNTILGTIPSSSAWATLSGSLNFNTKTGTISLGGSAPVSFSFVSESGTGMDSYGYLDFGISAAGTRLWLDNLDLYVAP